MFKFLSNLASIVLHPLAMPTIIYAIILTNFPVEETMVTSGNVFYVLALVCIATGFVPGISVYILYATGLISSITLEKRTDRYLPNLFAILIYLATAFLFYHKLGFRGVMFYAIICFSITIIVMSAITLIWKISVHACAMGGLVGFLFATAVFGSNSSALLLPCCISAFLLGCLMSARMFLGCHSSKQVWAGASLGIASAFMTIFLVSN